VQANRQTKPEYFFKRGEALPAGIRRILSEQLTQAVEVLSADRNSLEKAVHEARRSLKRARSLLRLVKFAIPKTYARENRRLRDVGRSLSELRDAHALAQTLEDLERSRNGGQADESRRAFASARTLLESRGERITKSMEQGGKEQSIAQLQEALTRIARLTYAKADARGIAKSIRRSVNRGTKTFAKAKDDPEPERFHEWRKRAKDLRYQISLLSELRPDLQQYSRAAKELEQLLGEDHNLAVLKYLLNEAQMSEGEELRPLRKKISGRQSALRDQAKEIGERLYGEKRQVWKDRLPATAIES
jgi:CHAD domain-containing protein